MFLKGIYLQSNWLIEQSKFYLFVLASAEACTIFFFFHAFFLSGPFKF